MDILTPRLVQLGRYGIDLVNVVGVLEIRFRE